MKHIACLLALCSLAASAHGRTAGKPAPAASPAAKPSFVWHTDAAAGFRVQAPPHFRIGREEQSNVFLLDPATKVTIMVACRPHTGDLSAWEASYRKGAKLPAWPARVIQGKSGECRFIQGTLPTATGPVTLTVGLYVRDRRGFEITVAAPAEHAAQARKLVPRAIGLFEITEPTRSRPKGWRK